MPVCSNAVILLALMMIISSPTPALKTSIPPSAKPTLMPLIYQNWAMSQNTPLITLAIKMPIFLLAPLKTKSLLLVQAMTP
jgi:hypothetical protein